MDLIALLAEMAATPAPMDTAEGMKWGRSTWNLVTTHPERYTKDDLLGYAAQAHSNGQVRLGRAFMEMADRA